MKGEQQSITSLSGKEEPIIRRDISSPLALLQIVFLRSVLERRGPWIRAIMRRHGLKTEELTLSYYPSNLNWSILRDHRSFLRIDIQGGKLEKIRQD
jgi:hypothetical protein